MTGTNETTLTRLPVLPLRGLVAFPHISFISTSGG